MSLSVLADFTGSKEVLLVTDGSEQCGGDPVTVAQSLADADPNLSIHVIGFDIQDAVAQQNLRNIPQVARGAYIQADTEEDLLQAMTVIIRSPFDVIDGSGEIVGRGLVNREPVSVAQDTFSVHIPDLELEVEGVFVEQGRGSSIVVDIIGEVEIIENDPICIAELCPNVPLPRLRVGERGRVNRDDPGRSEPRPVRVRTQPDLDGAHIASLDITEEFDVLDGPICNDGFLWWQVRNERVEGWSAEGVEGNYFLEPWT